MSCLKAGKRQKLLQLQCMISPQAEEDSSYFSHWVLLDYRHWGGMNVFIPRKAVCFPLPDNPFNIPWQALAHQIIRLLFLFYFLTIVTGIVDSKYKKQLHIPCYNQPHGWNWCVQLCLFIVILPIIQNVSASTQGVRCVQTSAEGWNWTDKFSSGFLTC